MNLTSLPRKVSLPYQQAVRVHERVIGLANTDLQWINQRLHVRTLNLLEHASCLATEQTGPAHARRVQLTRLALAKLGAVVEAAARMALISSRQAESATLEIAALEEMLTPSGADPGVPPQAPPELQPAETPAPPLAEATPLQPRWTAPDSEQPSASEPLSEEELLELRHLAQRDGCPATTGTGGTAPELSTPA
jgi:hypothetical protein